MKAWPGGKALDGVSLFVPAGHFAMLLGPSGCGKSTCLRIAAGLEWPDAGRVEIDGRDVTRLPPASRGIATVFQSSALFHHLSVDSLPGGGAWLDAFYPASRRNTQIDAHDWCLPFQRSTIVMYHDKGLFPRSWRVPAC